MRLVNLEESWSSKTKDLWIRPTDLSWHFPILGTVREEPLSNYRLRTAEEWKAKEEKLEEVNKERTKKGGGDWNDAHHHLPSPHLRPGNRRAQRRRASEPIGKHGPIGQAQTQRASVLIGMSQPMGIGWTTRASVLIGTNQFIGIAQLKRVNVLIGKNQPTGTAHVKRVSVLIGTHTDQWEELRANARAF